MDSDVPQVFVFYFKNPAYPFGHTSSTHTLFWNRAVQENVHIHRKGYPGAACHSHDRSLLPPTLRSSRIASAAQTEIRFFGWISS